MPTYVAPLAVIFGPSPVENRVFVHGVQIGFIESMEWVLDPETGETYLHLEWPPDEVVRNRCSVDIQQRLAEFKALMAPFLHVPLPRPEPSPVPSRFEREIL